MKRFNSKRLLAFVLAAAMIFSCLPGHVHAAENENLALGKTVTVSSYEDGTGYVGANIVDGDRSKASRWGTNQNVAAGEWAEIDLGASVAVKQIDIYFERPDEEQNILSFQVEICADGVYETVFTKSERASHLESIVLPETRMVEKVKITILDADGGTMGWVNAGISEVEIYGAAVETPVEPPVEPTENPDTTPSEETGTDPADASRDIPLNVLSATAGDYETDGGESEGPAHLVLDENEGTLWHTDWQGTSRENHWIQFELSEAYIVDGLRYQPRKHGGDNGTITEYDVLVSDDGSTFRSVATGNWENNQNWKLATFEGVQTRYVRLVAKNAVTDQSYVFASAAEIRLTGVKAAGHEHSFVETVASEAYQASAATCSAPATYYYSCACGEKDTTRTFEGEKLPHNYGAPVFNWNETAATAVFTCADDASHTETVAAAVTSQTTEGDCETGATVVYTATVTMNGETYTDTKTLTSEGGGHKYVNGFCSVCNGFEAAVNSFGVYQIANGGQLYWFAELVNTMGDDAVIDAVLVNDIVVNEAPLSAASREWTPIGYYKKSTDKVYYSGTFDGQGHTVSGLYCVKPGNADSGDYIGLFHTVDRNGTVKNVGVVNSEFTGRNYIGGVAGRNYYGTVTGCWNDSKITGNSNIGGVVGGNSGTVSNCYNTGAVSGTNTGTVIRTYTGGVVGSSNEGSVSNCYNTGDVIGNYDVFGIVGMTANNAAIDNCYYLADAETDSLDGTTFKTAAQFASGEVAYLLNGSTDTGDLVWKQTIGTHNAPAFAGEIVHYNPDSENPYYNGILVVVHQHNYVNGFCSGEVCDALYQEAPLVDGVYQIANAGQLYWFAALVNGGAADADAVLMENITVNENVLVDGVLNSDVSGFRAWTPIGGNGTSLSATGVKYTGTFDGNNKTVSGLYFSGKDDYFVGLIGYLDGGEVKNVGVIDSYISARQYFAGVVGTAANSTVQGCYNTGYIKAGGSSSSKYSQYFGGVVGQANGGSVISDCYNAGTIHLLAYSKNAGGVAGNLTSTKDAAVRTKITDSYNTGSFSCNANSSSVVQIGGVLGSTTYSDVERCWNDGAVVATKLGGTGGIVGKDNGSSVIRNCYNKGTVDCPTGNAGGIVGAANAQGRIENCYNIGTVSSADTVNAGGIVGNTYEMAGEIVNCYYLTGSCTGVNGVLTGSANSTVDQAGLTGKTADQFASGEVAYLLNGSTSEGELVWKQTIGTDAEPKFDGLVVYCNEGQSPAYSNEQNAHVHAFEQIAAEGYLATAATCENAATYYYSCVCGEKDTTRTFESGEALGHSYGEPAFVWADDNTAKATFTCQNDAEHTEVIDATVTSETTGNCETGTTVTYTATVTKGDNTYTDTKTVTSAASHAYVNGFCSGCDAYEPAELVDGVYQITNGGQLYWFAALVNGGETGVNAVLTRNITVNENVLVDGALNTEDAFRAWTPMNGYTGTFDGGEYTVSGIYFNDTNVKNVGLFGSTAAGAHVKNLTLADTYIAGWENVGGVVGNNAGTITNCRNEATLTARGFSLGGVAGNSTGLIEGCSNGGNIIGSNRHIGGVVGQITDATIRNCYNDGTVGPQGTNVGGVVGQAAHATVENCYNAKTGTVNVPNTTGTNNIGGVVGSATYDSTNMYGSTVVGCYNEGTVTSAKTAGGVVGSVGTAIDASVVSTVSKCYNLGSVACTGSSYAGGVAGSNDGGSLIENCYNAGTVTGVGTRAGGVVGVNNYGSNLRNSYNVGEVVNGSAVAAKNADIIPTNCYYLADSETDTLEGTSFKTAAQFASGEVAYLLNGSTSEGELVWKQTIGTDVTPKFDGLVVYCIEGQIPVYSNDQNAHVHVFDQQNTDEKYLATAATCEKAATYFYSCVCDDAHNSETFESGEALGHNYGAPEFLWADDNTAKATFTCQNDAEHTKEVEATVTSEATGDCATGTSVVYTAAVTFAEQEYTETKTVTTPAGHTYVNGFCVLCDAYEPAVEADGVYQIGNGGQLYWFAELVKSGSNAVNGKLIADIVVNEDVLNADGTLNGDGSNFRTWTPIGTVAINNAFIGDFDGAGFTVSGLYFNDSTASFVGFIGAADAGCSVKDLTVADSWFSGNQKVGGIVGEAFTGDSVTGCTSAATIQGNYEVGGIVGGSYGTDIIDCVNTGLVIGTENATNVGGIAGFHDNTAAAEMIRCANQGDVQAPTGARVGGLAGNTYGTSIIDCYNTGAISGSTYVGGVVGFAQKTSVIRNCYSIGQVSGSSYTAGLAGYRQPAVTLENNYYLADSETDSYDGTTFKTAAQFAYGEVAYLLNGSTSEGELVWKQTIGTDAAPKFEGQIVYQGYDSCADDAQPAYSNDSAASAVKPEHTWGDWEVTKPATTTEEGEETRKCSVCEKTETRPIEQLKQTFTDVVAGSYYEDAVNWAVENGITSGTTDTTFSPTGECVRAQAVTFLWRAAGCPEPKTTENPFVDVVEGTYYYDAVLWAVENGITMGTSETTFDPYVACSRAHVVSFLWRAAGQPKPATTENPFTDVSEGTYYYDAVLWAVENGITSGMTADAFEPHNSCNRAQIVTFLYRASAN